MSRVSDALRRSKGMEGRPVTYPTAFPVSIESYPTEGERTSERAAALADPFVPERIEPERIEPVRPVPIVPVPHLVASPPVAVTGLSLSPKLREKVVTDPDTAQVTVEEYRRMAANLHLAQAQSGLKTVLVSSALPQDGKSLTSTNLALTLSESYQRRVLLIDADLRRPTLHATFRVSNGRGLAEALAMSTAPMPIIRVSEYLDVLPAGHTEVSPMAGLSSERMRDLLADARSRYDWVLIDTPPVALLSDANLVAQLADGVILVIGAGSTQFASVKRAVLEFGRERLLGVVLNRVEQVPQKSYYHDYAKKRPSGERGPSDIA